MCRFWVIGLVGLLLMGVSFSAAQAGGRYGHWRYPDTPGFYPQRATFGFGTRNLRYGRSYGYGNRGWYREPFRRSFYGSSRGSINIYLNNGRRGFGNYPRW